ncbi:PEP-CTERM sorting domain-containing protein [Alteromonas sp. H39]|uniref:PEP-CTERM sorting domain-containing protein n=1 Tax=Alteromonas sp. H39 TaxID=3389876 RepID=UPI0039E06A66
MSIFKVKHYDNNITVLAIVTLVLCLSTKVVRADIITLDFEGVGNQAAILDYYNGGTDSLGNSGTNYGIGFGSNSLALTESEPLANFALPPSGETVMFFLTGSAILNYAAGFDTGFSFWYSTVGFGGSVNVYDGLNATGNLLGSITIEALGAGPVIGDPFSNWEIGGLSFNGLARSIDFGGTVNQVGYDDITFGSATPGQVAVNAPGVLSLFLVGAFAIVSKRRQYRKS